MTPKELFNIGFWVGTGMFVAKTLVSIGLLIIDTIIAVLFGVKSDE